MMGANAISQEFPLYSKFSNRNNSQKCIKISKLRQFPDIKYGNNYESPSYLKISNYANNIQSYNNPFIDPPNLRINNISSREKIPIFDQEIAKDIKEFLPKDFKFSNRASKSIDFPKTAIKEKEFFSISPKIEKYQSSYLPNMNDYDIRESYQENQSRVQNFERKQFEDYNPVVNKNVHCTPDKIHKVKWGQFYENYLFLSKENDAGFKIKKDYFTNFIDKNMKLISKNKPNVNEEKKEKDEISLSSGKTSLIPKKIKKYVQKSVDLSKIHEDKDEILKKNGIKLKHRSILNPVRSEKNLFQTKKIQEALDKNNLEKIRLLIYK